jgi:hypothetical protein
MTTKDIKKILSGIYDNIELRQTIVPLFLSNPGLGKTILIEEFFKERNKKLLPFITSQRNPFEISGLAMPDKDVKRMSFWDFDSLLELEDGDGIFLDEFGNGNPIVANACLTLLESRTMVSGKKLPKIMIVAAANPQGMMPLTPQIKERFVWYDVKYDKRMWVEYMTNKYSITENIGNKLSGLITGETFTSNNFFTPRSIDKAVNMIIHEVDTPYNKELLPVLSEMITNKFDKDIVLPNGKKVISNEMISWLDLIKLKINYKNEIITEQEVEVA